MITSDTAPGKARYTAVAAPPTLEAEARTLGRFVMGHDVDEEFVRRYAEAHAYLDIGVRVPGDEAVLRFALDHEALLPCLDAAAALMHPHSLLHRKAMLMVAILEASPRYADDFLPRTSSWPGLVWLFVRVGTRTALQAAVGLPLLYLLGRRA